MPKTPLVQNNEKDPICKLKDIIGEIVWNAELFAGVHNRCCFTISTVINGKKFSGTGTTLKTAKRLCALEALNQISEVKNIFGSRNQINDCKAIVRKKSLPSANQHIEQTECKMNRKLLPLQDCTNLQSNFNQIAVKTTHNFNVMDDRSKGENFNARYFWQATAPMQDLDNNKIKQDKEIMSALPSTLGKIGSDCIAVNADITNSTTNSEQTPLVIDRNEKVSDYHLKNTLPIVMEDISDDCIIVEQNDSTDLPSSSRLCQNPVDNKNKFENCGLQSQCDSKNEKPITKEINSLDLGPILRSKLDVFKSSTQGRSNVNMGNVQAKMTMCTKSFAKNPIGDGSSLYNQVESITQSIKRTREVTMELEELPPPKIHAIDKSNVLSNQGQCKEKKLAIECLKMLQPNLKFTLESQIGNLKEPYFMVSAMVVDRKFIGHGKTVQSAEYDAAIQIVNFLTKNKDKFRENSIPPRLALTKKKCQQTPLYNKFNNEVLSSLSLQSSYADIIETKVMQAFHKLTYKRKEFSRCNVLAGIIMTFHMNFVNSMVVSIATGTKCVNGGNICCNGSVINDSHAEVIAKRGLMKFLFNQLQNICSSDTMQNSVFEKSSIGYKLKPFVHFHLYISTAPCGDARVFNFAHNYIFNNFLATSFNSVQYGQLRTKVEGEVGTTPIGSRVYPQTWDGVVLGEPLHTMSCSDKIALWNVVGIQGALLSQFVEPIYLRSITLGSLFNEQHMYRAICGRIQGTLGQLPQSYHLNMPLLGQTSNQLRRCTFKPPGIGINWTQGDNDIEIISLPTGRSIYNKTSFLSKQAFFFKYFYLCNNLPNLGFVGTPINIYSEAKRKAKDYQNAKQEVFKAFHKANLGNWVKKPKEQNEFAMNITI